MDGYNIPPLFVIMLYCAIIIITTMSVIYFVKKKVPFPPSLKKIDYHCLLLYRIPLFSSFGKYMVHVVQ